MDAYDEIISVATHLQNEQWGDLTWFEALQIAGQVLQVRTLRAGLMPSSEQAETGMPSFIEAIAMQLGFTNWDHITDPTLNDKLDRISEDLTAIAQGVNELCKK